MTSRMAVLLAFGDFEIVAASLLVRIAGDSA
jgi:hypothetical protein